MKKQAKKQAKKTFLRLFGFRGVLDFDVFCSYNRECSAESVMTAGEAVIMKVLYLTDPAYAAKGRRYCEEDIFITDRLKERFDIALCHPGCA